MDGAATTRRPPPSNVPPRVRNIKGQSWPPKGGERPRVELHAWEHGALLGQLLLEPRTPNQVRPEVLLKRSELGWCSRGCLPCLYTRFQRHAGIQDFGVPLSMLGMHALRDPPVGGSRSWRREGRLASHRLAVFLMQLGGTVGGGVVAAPRAHYNHPLTVCKGGQKQVVLSGVAHEFGKVGCHSRALPQPGGHRRAGGPKAGHAYPTPLLPPPLVPPGFVRLSCRFRTGGCGREGVGRPRGPCRAIQRAR